MSSCFFVPAEYPDFPDVRVEETVDDGVAKGTRATGDQ
jgi:hypothetical protein